MFNKELVEKYIEIVKADPEGYYKDNLEMQEKAKKSSAIYKGQPIPITYQGMFISEENHKDFKRISKIMMEITRKVSKKYLEDEEYRELFKHDKKLEELILLDPGYQVPVPMARYDIFYNGFDDFKFCEFNTDGSSAMNEDAVLGAIMLETKAFKEMGKDYKISQFELFDSWVDASLAVYRSSKGPIEKPNIAIVDFIDKGTTKEFERFVETYEKKGYNCKIVDPRDIKYIGGLAYYQDYRIDMVYRRAVTMDVMEAYDQIPDFIEAYKNNAFVCIGSFRSQLMHSKLIFKILRHPMTREIVTKEEYDFLVKHVPYTEELITEGDYQRARANKDGYILKPYDGYASYSVHAGREYSQEDWEKVLDDCLGKGYIYQEYFDVDKVDFIEFDENGRLTVDSFAFVLGMFIYNENFQGLYTRIGNHALISGARDYYTTPNFLFEELK